MSLRAKVLLILTMTVVAYAGADHLLQRTRVYDSYVALEETEAHKDLQRVVESIHAEIVHLDDLCRGWAEWDDTCEFVASPSERFASSNLSDATILDRRRLNLVIICDDSGKVLFNRIADLDSREPLKIKRLPSGSLSLNHPLLRIESVDDKVRGIYTTEHGPMLVSARPILTSEGLGPIRGTMIVGKLLNEAFVKDLSDQVSVEFDVFDEDEHELAEAEQEIRTQLTISALASAGKEDTEEQREYPKSSFTDNPEDDREIYRQAYSQTTSVMQIASDEELYAYTTFRDITLAPALFVRARIPRAISAQGRTSITYAALSTMAASLLLMLVLTILLRRVVLNPLKRLTDHAVMIGSTEDFTAELHLDRKDELGILSREFDGMMKKLEKSKAALAQAARAAGMSEIATGVLHNVGNALNSVNVSATLATNKARNSCSSDLGKMLQVISDSAMDLADFLAKDPRGAHFYPMLTQIAAQLTDERTSLSKELGEMSEGLEHIKELVRSQQSFAGRSGVLEKTALGSLVEQAVNISGLSLEADSEIEIGREYETVEPFDMDRNRVLEVLVNLIQNAKQSIREAKIPNGRIRITASSSTADQVLIEVADNGLGIDAANLTSVFNHGFTTKIDGHGFGLHTSANAATEMKGRLTAHSDGPGKGATFALEIPMNARLQNQVAA